MPTKNLPKPVLLLPLKHHLLYIREFIGLQRPADEAILRSALKTIGSSQLDLYLGALSPLQIADQTITYLQQQHALGPEAYRQYISSSGTDYHVITLSDGSDWVLRWGLVAGRYVHLHPARNRQDTIRVKANTLKTAIAVIIAARQYKQPLELQLINQVRTQWLELAPLKRYTAGEGLDRIIKLLSPKAGRSF